MISHRLRTREAPRELLPKLPPSRGSSQSALAGTPVSKRPCEHSDPTPGRSPVPVRSDAESPKAPRRETLAGSAAAPCEARRERHDEPLPARRGLRDRSCSTNECRRSRRRRQPPGEPGFRASGLLFARPCPGAGPMQAAGGDDRAHRRWGRGSRGDPNPRRGEGWAGWPRKARPRGSLGRSRSPLGASTLRSGALSVTLWRRAAGRVLHPSRLPVIRNLGSDAGPAATGRSLALRPTGPLAGTVRRCHLSRLLLARREGRRKVESSPGSVKSERWLFFASHPGFSRLSAASRRRGPPAGRYARAPCPLRPRRAPACSPRPSSSPGW